MDQWTTIRQWGREVWWSRYLPSWRWEETVRKSEKVIFPCLFVLGCSNTLISSTCYYICDRSKKKKRRDGEEEEDEEEMEKVTPYSFCTLWYALAVLPKMYLTYNHFISYYPCRGGRLEEKKLPVILIICVEISLLRRYSTWCCLVAVESVLPIYHWNKCFCMMRIFSFRVRLLQLLLLLQKHWMWTVFL